MAPHLQPLDLEPAAPSEPNPSLGALEASLLTPRALAALAPAAGGIPREVWQRVLLAPIADMLGRPGKGFRARFTALAFGLGGGRGTPPPALGAMLEVVHAGSMIVDDIEDEAAERRDAPALHHRYGVPLALNAGNWMYFAPFALLEALGLPPATELALRRRFERVLLDCHFGQALDLGARLDEIPQADVPAVVATLRALKTGRLLGFAAELGARAAGADDPTIDTLVEFAELVGDGLQMLDDLGNLSPRTPANKRYEDLCEGRLTSVWAWAASSLSPATYAQLLARHARADEAARGEGGRAPGAFAPLGAQLRALVEVRGRSEARARLHAAQACLQARFAGHALLAQVTKELARLEASYG